MTEAKLEEYLAKNFPQENERCEWKEFKSLKHAISAREGDDIISYISAIANMQGGHLVLGVADSSLDIIGIQDLNGYNVQSLKLRLLKECSNLSDNGLQIEEYVTSDTNKKVWVIHIPKHQYRLPVYAHKKLWQRVGDSLIQMSASRLDAILNEVRISEDWTAVIVPEATLDD